MKFIPGFTGLLLLSALLACQPSGVFAQVATEADPNLQRLQIYEDSLRVLGDSLVRGKSYTTREEACLSLIPTLVRALKTPDSYQYPFDSIGTVSITEAPDNRFRIFTFQMLMWDATYRYYGAIQMNSEELELIPLIDLSLFIPNPEDTMLTPDSWYGCVYYNILHRKHKRTDYYYLFGWDGNDMTSTKKLIDVLHFNKKGEAHFGAPVFGKIEEVEPKKKEEVLITSQPPEEEEPVFEEVFKYRFFIHYKKDAAAGLNYDPYLEKIIYDHLIPQNPLSEGVYSTYVSDGSYEGFEYKKGKWRYIEKVFEQTQAAPTQTGGPANPQSRDPFIYKERKTESPTPGG